MVDSISMKRILLITISLALYIQCFSQWISIYQSEDPYNAITSYDSVIICGCSYDCESDLIISTDYGLTWTDYDPFPGVESVYSLTSNDSMVYACTSNGIFRALKSNLDWNDFSMGLSASPILKVVMHDSIYFAVDACNSNLFRRTEGDDSWSVLSGNSPVGNISDIDYDGNVLVLAGYDGIAESYDPGIDWTLWNGYEFEMTSVKIKGDTIIAASKGGIFRKIISSGNILKVCTGLMPLWNPYGYEYYGEFESFHQIDHHLFVCGETGVYKLQDNIWSWLNTGIGGWTYSLSDNGVCLLAAFGYDGIRSRPLDELILHRKEHSISQSLFRIFPNPASNVINISSGSTISELAVYDHYGKLVHHVLPHNSNFSVQVNNLSPGLYLIVADTPDEVSCQKLIIISE